MSRRPGNHGDDEDGNEIQNKGGFSQHLSSENVRATALDNSHECIDDDDTIQQTFICYNRGLSQDSDKSDNACRGKEEENVLLTDRDSTLLYEKYSAELAAEIQRNDSNAQLLIYTLQKDEGRTTMTR